GAQRRARDVLEHEAAVADEPVGARHARNADETLVDALLALEQALPEPAEQQRRMRLLDDHAASARRIKMHGRLIAAPERAPRRRRDCLPQRLVERFPGRGAAVCVALAARARHGTVIARQASHARQASSNATSTSSPLRWLLVASDQREPGSLASSGAASTGACASGSAASPSRAFGEPFKPGTRAGVRAAQRSQAVPKMRFSLRSSYSMAVG